jgi:HlyD family secretion protein
MAAPPSAANSVVPDPEVVARLGLDARAGRRRWLARALLALIVAGAAALGVQQYLARRAAGAPPKFATAAVARRTVEVVVTATGTLQGLGTVEVGAEVSGKLIAVHVDYNDTVKQGQVLAEIDPEQLRAAVAEATARVQEADAAVRQSEATRKETAAAAERAQVQAAQGLISKAELDTALAAAERATASVASARAGATLARATLESARSRLAKTRIVSPIDGVVLSRLVEPGQTMTAGFQTPLLFKIAEDLRRMSLHVFVDEADIGRAREGQPATFSVDAYPGKVFPSSVLELRNEARIEQNVVTYEAVLAVDNSESLLRPGMTATATIIAGRRENVLTVPNAALRFTPPREQQGGLGPPPAQQVVARALGKKQVFVLRDGKPVAVEVVPGASDGSVTEIVSGPLSAGTEVIVDLTETATERQE